MKRFIFSLFISSTNSYSLHDSQERNEIYEILNLKPSTQKKVVIHSHHGKYARNRENEKKQAAITTSYSELARQRKELKDKFQVINDMNLVTKVHS